MDKAIFELSYEGAKADAHYLDFYDATIALMGFQRSLAIITHAVINNEVITQTPYLRGANILISPPESGSWKTFAVVTGAIYTMAQIGSAPKDSVTGNIIGSAYDYVISNTLGFHVYYDKTLGEQYREIQKGKLQIPIISKSRMESVIEKCENSIRDIHRPIVKSQSAVSASIKCKVGSDFYKYVGQSFTRSSYDRMNNKRKSHEKSIFRGKVSSYNMNTFKGRVYILDKKRPIPFELEESARTAETISIIASNLADNASEPRSRRFSIEFECLTTESITGRLISIIITGIL